ncbi:MAG: peroxide stress protein YaaA [Coxiellaceae bacterium]|nr:peroxide stress protein YaaA [Coxiellaceae bacterium]
MLLILSPAKKQNFDAQTYAIKTTQPQNKKHIAELVNNLQQLSEKKLQQLMSLSPALTQLNFQRFQDFDVSQYNSNNAKPAVFALQGDAYQGLQVDDFNKKQLEYLQQHLLILSGLYGYLRPMDLIQPYRLEMKTKLAVNDCKDLYTFWQDSLTTAINKLAKQQSHDTLLNLASNEYFKALDKKQLSIPIITAQFKQQRGNEFKMIGIYAKRARGLMTRFVAKHQLSKTEDIKRFDLENYRLNKEISTDTNWIFCRQSD